MKAIALISGGLDSTLAAKLIADQGVEVHALHFLTVFSPGLPSEGRKTPGERAAEALGIPIHFMDHTQTMIDLLKNPPHSFGAHLNPCIDCHMAMLRKASSLMASIGANFVLTGEVLGQRPMSQNRQALSIIDAGAGLPGLIVRPLCARCLDPTIPEKEGWIDREKLLDFRGRSRKPQMELARRLDITKYPSPAGGCLLTDPGFSRRLKDLLDHGDFSLADVELLKVGRHLRLSPRTKLVIGRNEPDCLALETLVLPNDLVLETADVTGPLGVLRGDPAIPHLPGSRDRGTAGPVLINQAASILARYSRLRSEASARISVRTGLAGEPRFLTVPPASPVEVEPRRVIDD
ncbi:MAG: hypothetical protein V2A58_11555 [Planctomycetota bacterium]